MSPTPVTKNAPKKNWMDIVFGARVAKWSPEIVGKPSKLVGRVGQYLESQQPKAYELACSIQQYLSARVVSGYRHLEYIMLCKRYSIKTSPLSERHPPQQVFPWPTPARDLLTASVPPTTPPPSLQRRNDYNALYKSFSIAISPLSSRLPPEQIFSWPARSPLIPIAAPGRLGWSTSNQHGTAWSTSLPHGPAGITSFAAGTADFYSDVEIDDAPE